MSKISVSVKINRDTNERVKKLAQDANVTMSAMLNFILEHFLDQKDNGLITIQPQKLQFIKQIKNI